MLNTRLHQKNFYAVFHNQPKILIQVLLIYCFESENEVVWYLTMDPHLQFPAVFFLFMKMFFFVISVGMGFHFKWDVFSSVSSVSSEESKPGWFRSQVMKTLSGSFAEGDRSSLLNVSRFRPVIVVVTSDNVALKVIWDSTGSAPSLWNLADALKQSCALPLR